MQISDQATSSCGGRSKGKACSPVNLACSPPVGLDIADFVAPRSFHWAIVLTSMVFFEAFESLFGLTGAGNGGKLKGEDRDSPILSWWIMENLRVLLNRWCALPIFGEISTSEQFSPEISITEHIYL